MIGIDGDDAIEQTEQAESRRVGRMRVRDFQQVSLREDFEHAELVYQRRIENRIGVVLKRKYMTAFAGPHRRPARDSRGGVEPARMSIAHDAANEPNIGSVNAGKLVQRQLRQGTDENAKNL